MAADRARRCWPPATAYYIVNTTSVSVARRAHIRPETASRLERQLPLVRAELLSSAPRWPWLAPTIVNGASQWLLPILIPPVYLTFRSYKVYLGRLEDEQRHTQQVTELHDQAQQALKFAQQSARQAA